jgi:Uncharacterized protein, homolog of Cu resistance protein CopC
MQQRRFSVISLAFLLSVLAYICTTLVQPAPQVQAHAFVIASNPVDGSTIIRVPSDVQIYFNAPISSISTAHVYAVTANGNKVNVNAGASTVSATNPAELITTLKNPGGLPEGSYEVIWTAVALNDGHTTYGIIGFDVGYASTGVTGNALLGPTSSNNIADIRNIDFTSALAILWDWLVLLALIFWIGLQIFEHLLLKAGRGSGLFAQARKRTYSIEWLCLWLMFFGEIIDLTLRITRYAQASIDQGLAIGDLVRFVPLTVYGYIWLVRMLLLIGAMIFLYVTRNPKNKQLELAQQALEKNKQLRITQSLSEQSYNENNVRKTRQLIETPFIAPATPRGHSIAWLLLVSLITLSFVLTSSVTMVLTPHISAIVLGWLALVAQGVWIGGFAYLAYILLPLLSNTELEYNTETLLYLLRKSTPFLCVGMGVQVFCLLFASEASISDPQQLLNDPFGRTLLIQIILLALTILLTLHALCIVRPKLTHLASLLPVVKGNLPARQTRQTAFSATVKKLQHAAILTTLIGAGMLLCIALQTFYAPPINFPARTYSNPTATSNGAISTQTRLIGNLAVTLQIAPGRTGFDHAIMLTINDSKGNPVTDAQVTAATNMVLMDMGTQQVTLSGGDPLYTATLDKKDAFNMPGLWNIDITIERPGQQPVKTSFKMTLTS